MYIKLENKIETIIYITIIIIYIFYTGIQNIYFKVAKLN